MEMSSPPDVDDFGRVVMLKEKETARGQIVDVHELAARFTRTPDDHFLRAGHLGFCAFRKSAGSTCEKQIEIVVRPVKIRRHGGNEIRAVFARVSLAKLHPRNLRDRIRFVGWVQRPRQKRLFPDRLLRMFRVNA